MKLLDQNHSNPKPTTHSCHSHNIQLFSISLFLTFGFCYIWTPKKTTTSLLTKNHHAATPPKLQPNATTPWRLQEPLFRNGQLSRQLPFEARLALAEVLVTQQAALWADEVEAKEVPKKEGWKQPTTAGGVNFGAAKLLGFLRWTFFFLVGDYAKKASERTKFSWRFWNENFNHFDVRQRNAMQKKWGKCLST